MAPIGAHAVAGRHLTRFMIVNSLAKSSPVYATSAVVVIVVGSMQFPQRAVGYDARDRLPDQLEREMVDATLITIHGLFSSPATWDRLAAVWCADKDLQGMRIHPFGYECPKKPRLPLSTARVPDYDDIAQVLATEYATMLRGVANIAIVSHSQGGLIVWYARCGRKLLWRTPDKS